MSVYDTLLKIPHLNPKVLQGTSKRIAAPLRITGGPFEKGKGPEPFGSGPWIIRVGGRRDQESAGASTPRVFATSWLHSVSVAFAL